jgi:hypothetical protein
LAISWVSYFNHAVYGTSDRPIGCYGNPGRDSLTSHPSFQTSIVAPGEIEDRYRNANPLQGIGYPAGLLGGLFTAAEVLRIAGFDMYGYRGAHQQSIETATEYYACFAKYVGFKKTVTADNARACPNYQQYIGKVVNGVDPDMVIGAYRFPANAAITSLEAAAKVASSTGPFSLDAIHFGKWRD